MEPRCRAADTTTCRVHGTGGMYQHLREVSNEAIRRGDFDSYYDARHKMDQLTDDSKKALKFYKRGGVPTVTERVIEKMNGIADRIIETRDNINNTVYEMIEEEEKRSKEKAVKSSKQDESQEVSIGEKIHEAADRIIDARDDINETVSVAVDVIADRHKREIPAEIGGSTVEWADLNPFKNKKLR